MASIFGRFFRQETIDTEAVKAKLEQDWSWFEPEDIQTYFGFNPKKMFRRLIMVHIVKKDNRILLQVDARDGIQFSSTIEAYRRRNFIDTDLNRVDMSIRHYWFAPTLPWPDSDDAREIA